MSNYEDMRNVAIVAHVDHGKTTLVDAMLKQAGTFRDNENVRDRVMDSMDLEKERGITIAAKNTALYYDNCKINVVDTPGHSDFGAEVQRILSMVDGVVLLVDAAEGPLPQTRYVLSKALEMGLKSILVINKVDRKDARAQEVLDEVFSLYIDLGADDEQCDFPTLFAIGKDGIASYDADKVQEKSDLKDLFHCILNHIPSPKFPKDQPLQMLVSNLGYSEYLGRLAIGRVIAGQLEKNTRIAHAYLDSEGEEKIKYFKVQALFTYEGLEQKEVDSVQAGDIAILAGIDEVNIGDSLVDEGDGRDKEAVKKLILDRIPIDEPTLQVEFIVNNSPFAGKEGKHVTSRKIRERLEKEAYTNVALRFQETNEPDRFLLKARGELQISIVAETMRREGYEFALGQPQILTKEVDGKLCEPIEWAILDIPSFAQGRITQMLQERKGLLHNIEHKGADRLRLTFRIPARGLIGLRSQFLTETCGEGLFNISSAGFEEHKGAIPTRSNGSLIADRQGESNSYALENLQERGILFIKGQTPVYEGMIIGENARTGDLNVNPCKTKQLTNFRTVNKDDAIVLTPPRAITIESGLEWMADDELLEVTPESLRLRKKQLAKNFRS